MYVDYSKLRPYLLDYLHKITGELGIRRGGWLLFHAPYRDDKTPSLSVSPDGLYYHDFGDNCYGSIIDLCARVNHCTTGMAAQILIGLYRDAEPPAAPQPSRAAKQEDNEPSHYYTFRPLCNTALLAYANGRGVDSVTMRTYCEEAAEKEANSKGGHYYYIAMPTDNGGYELRNQYAKRTATGAKKDITTIGPGTKTAVLLFEGMFDALAYLSNVHNVLNIADIIILNSTTNIQKAIQAAKRYDTVICYLDNDEAGRAATAAVLRDIPTAEDHAPRYAPYNDVNDYICALLKQEGRLPREGGAAVWRK